MSAPDRSLALDFIAVFRLETIDLSPQVRLGVADDCTQVAIYVRDEDQSHVQNTN